MVQETFRAWMGHLLPTTLEIDPGSPVRSSAAERQVRSWSWWTRLSALVEEILGILLFLAN